MIAIDARDPVRRRDLSAGNVAPVNGLPTRLFARRIRTPLQTVYALPAPSDAIEDALLRLAAAERTRNVVG